MEDITKSHFYLTYDEVITKAQAIQPYFAADLKQFTAFDPWYTSAVNTELVSDIYIGLKDFSKKNLLSEIKQVTDMLDISLASAMQFYMELIQYVERGFTEVTIRNDIFGYLDFENARHSVKKMVALLKQAHAAILCDDYQARLVASGMTLDLTIEVADTAAEMSALYGELKMLKKQHLIVTRERIELFNSLWDTLSGICEDAQSIFANDPDRLEIYDLYDTENWNLDHVEILHLN